MPGASRLPDFIAPMLARSGEPFDADDHVFEIKWDGMRVVAFRDADGVRLVNRQRNDVTARYPDLAGLDALAPGTVLDGEIVVFDGERSSFERMLRREQARDPRRIATLAGTLPAHFVAFDLLYDAFAPRVDDPLVERRARLAAVVEAAGAARLLFSDGLVGGGRAFYDAAVERELEGVVAKQLSSRYVPGKRTDAWCKIKRAQVIFCVVVGFLAEGRDVRSLIVATDVDGDLAYAGRVGSGIDAVASARLAERLWPLERPEPIIPCRTRGTWVEPHVYCRVRFLERTGRGDLRAPVFLGLVDDA